MYEKYSELEMPHMSKNTVTMNFVYIWILFAIFGRSSFIAFLFFLMSNQWWGKKRDFFTEIHWEMMFLFRDQQSTTTGEAKIEVTHCMVNSEVKIVCTNQFDKQINSVIGNREFSCRNSLIQSTFSGLKYVVCIQIARSK